VAARFGHVAIIQPDMQKGLREKPLKDVARFPQAAGESFSVLPG